MSDARPPLGLDPADFLAHVWQQRPLLLRGALSDWTCPLDANELAGLACEEDVASRLVLGPDADGNWRVEHGPFDESRFADLPDADWTLLVQDLDKWVAPVGDLLHRFSFLPSWRIDDIMISYAAPGGSVGPHWDHYDVFLVQLAGRRRWQIDDRDGPELVARDDQALRLLQSFDPNQEWTLSPGDMLYLPPEVPHHGVSLDADCLTLSLGMRAPSQAEMLVDLAEQLAVDLPERARYADPGIEPPPYPALIPPSALQRVRTIINRLTKLDDDTLADWFGGFVTRYGLTMDAVGEPDWTPAAVAQLLARGDSLVRNPWVRWAVIEHGPRAVLYANGERYETTVELARLVTTEAQIQPAIDAASTALLAALLQAGAVATTASDG